MISGTRGEFRALLALEDGTVFKGWALGRRGVTDGELVFNTSFCGYEEILTDPSYRFQIVCMAFPSMGNYGFHATRCESGDVQVAGFVVADAALSPSNRKEANLDDYLNQHGVIGIEGVDTRAIVRRVRSRGALRAVLSSRPEDTAEKLIARAKSLRGMAGCDLVHELPPRRATVNPSGKIPVALLDCGVKQGIVDSLARRDCRVEIFPASTKAEEILAIHPAGLLLSNGPGDPEVLQDIVAEIRKLLGKFPVFGICLGHQLLGWAAGGRTYKLPFGHRGANHPVLDLTTRAIAITSQNHGFAVDESSLPEGVIATERNLYDGTNEGISIPSKNAFSVQYHPEACPGPCESGERFDRFLARITTKVRRD